MRNFQHTFHFSFLLAAVVVSVIMLSSGINHVLLMNAVGGDLEVQTYEYGTGYGYRIFSGENIIIQQNHIPSLENDQPFCNRGQAESVADLVMQKLQHGANPAISFSELEELKIAFNCAE